MSVLTSRDVETEEQRAQRAKQQEYHNKRTKIIHEILVKMRKEGIEQEIVKPFIEENKTCKSCLGTDVEESKPVTYCEEHGYQSNYWLPEHFERKRGALCETCGEKLSFERAGSFQVQFYGSPANAVEHHEVTYQSCLFFKCKSCGAVWREPEDRHQYIVVGGREDIKKIGDPLVQFEIDTREPRQIPRTYWSRRKR